MSPEAIRPTPFLRLLTAAVAMALLFATPMSGRAATQDAEPEPLSNEQIEQLVAPIALHPDDLLSQILMASTYPLEVVQAARWAEANPKVTGDALEDAMQKQPWDPSVKSLATFPQVLEMMNEELAWTQQLGDAFLAQQKDVMDAVQRLRDKADAAGNLKTTKQQKVEKQAVTTASGAKETVIVIQPADPEVIYVPAYNPTIVYGTWPYPAYPPYYWYPPGYVARNVFWFATGVAVGRALWGRCDWGRGSVNINVNRYNSFNRTKINSSKWRHSATHRRGVPYKNRKVSERYRKGTRDARSREQFRGRAEAGRRDLATRDRPGGAKRPGAGQRPTTAKRPAATKRPSTAKRPAAAKRPSQAKRPAAYQGIGKGPQVRKQSARGQRSRTASRSRPSSRPARSRPSGGPSRSRGGGGARRGGGRRR